MSVMPRRSYGAVVTLVLAVVGAAVAGAVLFTSSRADEVELTTAELVPVDTAIYAALNTDLSSGQWVRSFDLVKRMGRADPEQALRDSVEEDGDVDWEKDVAPFLGGNAAVFASGIDWEGDGFIGGVVLKAKDTERAVEVIREDVDGPVAEDEYRGVAYALYDDDGDLFVAIIGKHVVLTPNEASLRAVIDVHAGEAAALTSDPDFIRLRDELTGNFLGFVFVRPNVFATAMFEKLGFAGMDISPVVNTSPMAGVIGATKDAFEFQAASVTAAELPRALEPRSSRFAPMVTADTIFFFTTYGVGPAYADTVAAAGEMLAAFSSDLFEPYPMDPEFEAEWETFCEEYPEYCEEEADPFASPFDAGTIEQGVTSFAALLRLMDGELAVAAWPDDGDLGGATVLLAEVSDPAEALTLMDELVESLAMMPADEVTVGGVDVRVTADLAYGVADGYAFLGTFEGVSEVLGGVALPMTGNATYRDAVEEMPTGLGTFLYINMFSLLRSDAGEAIPELDAVQRALDGFIINAVSERGVVRVSGVLTVRER